MFILIKISLKTLETETLESLNKSCCGENEAPIGSKLISGCVYTAGTFPPRSQEPLQELCVFSLERPRSKLSFREIVSPPDKKIPAQWLVLSMHRSLWVGWTGVCLNQLCFLYACQVFWLFWLHVSSFSLFSCVDFIIYRAVKPPSIATQFKTPPYPPKLVFFSN